MTVDRDEAVRVAEGVLARQRYGPLDDRELARYLVDSVLHAAPQQADLTNV